MLDNDLRTLLDTPLERSVYADWSSVGVVSLGSRVVAVQATDHGIALRSWAEAALSEGPSAVFDAGTVVVDGERHAASALSATGLRDHVIVAYRAASTLRTLVFDPFSPGGNVSPHDIAPSTFDHSLAIAGDDKGGTAGVCTRSRLNPGSNPSELAFALVGEDGERIRRARHGRWEYRATRRPARWRPRYPDPVRRVFRAATTSLDVPHNSILAA